MPVSVIVILAAVVLILGYGVSLYNTLIRLKNQTENAWSQIDVQLKRRHDLIPNLVEVTKDAMDFEQETLTNVIEARNKAINASGQSREETINLEGQLTQALSKLLAVVEDYPDLKSNTNISELTEELTGTENRISFARQHYNDSATTLNTKVELFPSNLVASMFNFTKAVYFEVAEPEKQAIKVDLR